jgi:PAS domain S-box-containing protein
MNITYLFCHDPMTGIKFRTTGRVRRLFLMLFFALFPNPVCASDTRPEKDSGGVIIAIGRNCSPFTLMGPDGEPAGLLVEKWRLWSENTGCKIQFRPSRWAETIAAMKNGDADIHSGLFKTGDRAEWLSFSTPLFRTDTTLFFRNADSPTPLEISERNQVQETIQKIRTELQQIFDNTQVGILFLKNRHHLYRCNARAADILGYCSPGELAGMNMTHLHMTRKKFDQFDQKYYSILAKGEQVRAEYPLMKKDGTGIRCSLSGKALYVETPPELDKGVIRSWNGFTS